MTIRKATPADISRLCKTANIAFADDPVMRFFFPDDDEYFAGDGTVMRAFFRRWLSYDETYTTDDTVSLGAFIPPGRPEVEVVREPGDVIEHPPDRIERFVALGAALREHTPPEPHWYLNLLATHPDWQRQGLGAAVMAPIGEVCRRDGLPLYLETETIENVAYYNHLGFTVRSEWDVPLRGPHMWGMIRPPS